MSNKPLWFAGLMVVAAGVIWWGLNVQDQAKKKKEQESLEEKIKTYRVFIAEQEQQIKSMTSELKTVDDRALIARLKPLQKELEDLFKAKKDEPAQIRLGAEIHKLQVELNSVYEKRQKLEERISSFKKSVADSKSTLADTEKRLIELRGK